ncbi:hypothetical protein BTO30_04050 [Domibacillus antri]|uniref:Rpn family recombination-promoting nuclease/putative transposase n=1 Tax=Domibacillus antri TaxID=1714264 RepID=A0A1Q8Q775_9BACI|nr:Rpn family recombination-promoting nuclease/putative transposase [Domibacillus antri]OLN23151.1 hypothetical protein BTO30_04050 [Domibacillus antri]
MNYGILLANKSVVMEKWQPRFLKRISLDRLMDLKVDYAFKALFGSEKNKRITIVFLNAVLQKSGREPIDDLAFMNVEAGGEHVDDKQSRLDILAKTEKGEWLNIEIQLANQYDMVKRTLFYWSSVYRAQLKKGMPYTSLQPVITINILNFELFTETKMFVW